jgi:hypothetical protein
MDCAGVTELAYDETGVFDLGLENKNRTVVITTKAITAASVTFLRAVAQEVYKWHHIVCIVPPQHRSCYYLRLRCKSKQQPRDQRSPESREGARCG